MVTAIAEAASDAWMYGDPENYTLRRAIATHHGVEPDNIMVGEGIDGLFGYVVRIFVESGDSVVTSQGAYPTFNYHVVGYDGQLVTVRIAMIGKMTMLYCHRPLRVRPN